MYKDGTLKILLEKKKLKTKVIEQSDALGIKMFRL